MALLIRFGVLYPNLRAGIEQKSTYWRKDDTDYEEKREDGFGSKDRSKTSQCTLKLQLHVEALTAMLLIFVAERQYLGRRSMSASILWAKHYR